MRSRHPEMTLTFGKAAIIARGIESTVVSCILTWDRKLVACSFDRGPREHVLAGQPDFTPYNVCLQPG